MIRLVKLLLFLFILSFQSCEAPPLAEIFYTITIDNHSPQPIYFLVSGLDKGIQYPDTTLPIDRPALVDIPAGGYYDISSRISWDEYFAKLSSDTLTIFFLDAKVFEDINWPIIREDYRVIGRYDLSLSDLNRLNFYVRYPPNNTMDGIRMYPK
jgi:hypothetical protein